MPTCSFVPTIKQSGSDGLGHQDGPRLAGEELQSPSEIWLDGVEYGCDRLAVGASISEGSIGTATPPNAML